MLQEFGDLHLLTVVMGFWVLFMGRIDVLQECIACVPGETSASPPTSVLVARSPFTALFVPNGMWKGVKCGVFFARNQIRNLKIWWKTRNWEIIVKGFVDRWFIGLELFKLDPFCSNLVHVAVLHIWLWFAPGSGIDAISIDTADCTFLAALLSKSLWGFKICVHFQVIVSRRWGCGVVGVVEKQ